MLVNVIYYSFIDATGHILFGQPLVAEYDNESDAWVDWTTGRCIEFIGHVNGQEEVFSSPSRQEVQDWINQHA